jgi:hypothetical protein
MVTQLSPPTAVFGCEPHDARLSCPGPVSLTTACSICPAWRQGHRPHSDVSPCRGKIALRVAMIAWSIDGPGS